MTVNSKEQELSKHLSQQAMYDNANNSSDHFKGKELLQGKHFWIHQGETGFAYENIFGEYLVNTEKVILFEPYLLKHYQLKNLYQFCQLITKHRNIMYLHIITRSGSYYSPFSLVEKLDKLANYMQKLEIKLTYKLSQNAHDREIVLDNGWIIKIGRGLDIYLPPTENEKNSDDFNLRPCRETKIDIFNDKTKCAQSNEIVSLLTKEGKHRRLCISSKLSRPGCSLSWTL
jgi:hypothetical protein